MDEQLWCFHRLLNLSLVSVSLISASLGVCCSFPFTVSLSFCIIESILLYYQRLRIKHYQIQTCPYMTIIITKDKDCDSRKIMQPFLWGISESWRISTSQSFHFVGFSVVNPANQRAFVLFSRDSWLSNSRQEDHESGFKCLRNPAEEKTASVFSLNNGWENKSFFFFSWQQERRAVRQTGKQTAVLTCVRWLIKLSQSD